MISLLFPFVLGLALEAAPNPARAQTASGWEAGIAKSAITPIRPMWMAGYGARNKPSEGKIHELWAKSLALKDPRGRVAILVTLDLCGIGPDISNAVRDAARAQHGIDRDRIVLACSHTHSGPVVGHASSSASRTAASGTVYDPPPLPSGISR